MTLIARDSIRAQDIPQEGLAAALGYGDGMFAWSSQDWALFAPPIVSLSIVVSAWSVGDVLDIEWGDATPGQAPIWVDAFPKVRPARRRGTLYLNRSNWPQVVQALGWDLSNGRIPAGRDVDFWVSTLDGTQDLWFGTAPDGTRQPVPDLVRARVVAIQVKGSNMLPGNYDESVILDPTWIGRPGGDDMLTDQQAQQLAQIWNFLKWGSDSVAGDSALKPLPDQVAEIYNHGRYGTYTDPAGNVVDSYAKSTLLPAIENAKPVVNIEPAQLGAALRALAHQLDGQ